MFKTCTRFGRECLSTALVATGVIACLALGCFFSYRIAYEEHVTQRRLETERLLESFQLSTDRLFEYADTVLRSSRLIYSKYGHDYDWEDYLNSVKGPSSDSLTGVFTLVDKTGMVTYQSETPKEKLRAFGSMADLDHFQYFKEHTGDSLFVGATRYGRITGELQYRLVRPLLTPAGEFDGMVMLTLRPEHLINVYKNLQPGPNASLTVLTLEPKLIARYPVPPKEIYDKNLGDLKSQFGIDLLGQSNGAVYGIGSPFEAASKRDVFYRRLQNYPVVILAGLAEKDVWDEFSGYRNSLWTLFTVLGLIVITLSVMALMLRRTNQKLRDTLGEKQKIEDDLRIAAVTFETQEGVVITDAKGQIIKVNEAFSVSTGYTASEIIGKTPAILKSGQHDAAFYKQMWNELTASGHWSGEIWDRRKDGSLFAKWLTITAVKDAQGMVTNYVGAHVDITDRKQVEHELANYRQTLESQVKERTHDLKAAKEKAEAANIVKSAFLANMSHELRTPLNGVLGFAQIGHRNVHDVEKASNAFEKILSSGKHLLAVINDVLDFSSIEAGKILVEKVPVVLDDLINDTLDLVRARAVDKGIWLRFERSPGLPSTCIGDPQRISQVLMNLLANAVKFTEKGGVTLAVMQNGNELSFRVTDTGIGMTDAQMSQLFSPFHQVDATATRKFGGTGLGLAISKRILEFMGGAIQVESALGVGTTFEFRIPYVKAEPVLVASPKFMSLENLAMDKPLAGINILVAEDESINQMIIEELLAECGASVVIVGDGRQAADQILATSGSTFDIVLMDIQMPEMDGYEAARLISDIAPKLPIIAQTAHAFQDAQEKCLAAGMVDHISKPINPQELVAIILKHATRKSETVLNFPYSTGTVT